MLFSKSTILLGAVSLFFSVQTASASILDFSDLYTPDETIVLDIASLNDIRDNPNYSNAYNLEWQYEPVSGGHLYLASPYTSLEATLLFAAPQVVFGLDLHGHYKTPDPNYLTDWDSEDLTIRAYSSAGSTLLWENTYDLSTYNDLAMSNWLHVDMGGVSNVDYLTFTASKLSLPSIDNLNVEPVPIPGAVWLLGSGLVGMVALRRKSNK